METVAGLIGGLIGGVVLTVLGTVLVLKLQHQKRRLDYRIVSAGVAVRSIGKAGANLAVSVPTVLLSAGVENLEDSYEGPAFTPVKDVYGFSIILRNSGNTVLESPLDVRIKLHPTAKIVSAWVAEGPDYGNQVVEVLRDKEDASLLRVAFPFLNESDQLALRLLSVENEDQSCRVLATAPGLSVRALSPYPRRLLLAWVGITLSIVSAVAAFGLGASRYGVDGDPGTVGVFKDFPIGTLIIAVMYTSGFLAVFFAGFGTVVIGRSLRREKRVWIED